MVYLRTVHLKAVFSRHNRPLNQAATTPPDETAIVGTSVLNARNSEQADLPSRLRIPTRAALTRPTVTGSQFIILSNRHLHQAMLPHRLLLVPQR
jgi:hypothetical protein